MGEFSLVHWLVVAVVVVLLFGTKKLPELGEGLGKAISNFKKSMKDANPAEDIEKLDKK